MGLRIGRVRVLIRVKRPLDLIRQAACHPVVRIGVLGEEVGRRHDDLDSVGPEQILFLLGDLVGNGADHPIATNGPDQRKTHTCIA